MFRRRAGVVAAVLLIVGCLGGLTPAWAVRVNTLYQATVPVPDRSATALKRAFGQALAEVLVKVTGDQQVASNPGLAAAFQQPAQYVQQYSYVASPASPAPPGSPPPPPTSGPPTPALQLQIHFAPPAVNTLLKTAQLPLWGQERPLVILWVGVDMGLSGRFLVGDDTATPHPAARQALLQAAQNRGLPVIFPLYDLKDQGRVHFADLAGGFLGPVRAASARYGANAELVGVVRRAGDGQWRGQWTLSFRTRTAQWTTQGGDRNAVLASGLDGVADRLAAQLAVVGATVPDQAMNTLDLVISGVNQIGDFTRIDHRLTHLEPIASVHLVKVEGGRLTFRVQPRGTIQDVSRNLALLNWLVASSPPPETQPASPPLPVNSSQMPAAATVVPAPATAVPAPSVAPRPVLYFRYQP